VVERYRLMHIQMLLLGDVDSYPFTITQLNMVELSLHYNLIWSLERISL